MSENNSQVKKPDKFDIQELFRYENVINEFLDYLTNDKKYPSSFEYVTLRLDYGDVPRQELLKIYTNRKINFETKKDFINVCDQILQSMKEREDAIFRIHFYHHIETYTEDNFLGFSHIVINRSLIVNYKYLEDIIKSGSMENMKIIERQNVIYEVKTVFDDKKPF